MEHIVVFITASSEEEAARIGHKLVEESLAACVNIVRSVRSIYCWEGKIEDEAEVLMVVKTRERLFEKLSQQVKALHSYSVPEIIAFPIKQGSPEYLQWLDDVTCEGDAWAP
ncbi:MAG: divalent-cation tolerance protein CutA [Thermodesulfovibrionales bacterium]